MKDIYVNNKLLDRTSDQLNTEIAQFPALKNEPSMAFLLSALNSALHYENLSANRLPALLTGKKIPFDEIFSLLKDCYQGKTKNYLQEILNNAEIELLVNKSHPDDPNSSRQLEVKIKLAAAVINKYADLISMVLGEKHSKNQSEIIHNATLSLKKLNNQLNGINLLYLVSKLKTECQHCIEQYQPNSCFSFFCSDKMLKNLKILNSILSDLMQQGFATAEIMGGLLILAKIIPNILGTNEIGNQLSSSVKQIIVQNHLDNARSPEAKQMIEVFLTRAKQLEVTWPEPFVLNTPTSFAEFPTWSPGLEAI